MDQELIQAYNKTRHTKNKSVLCHAPFSNINFEQNGNATACCYNRTHVLGTYPTDSVEDMWFGDKAEELRQYLRQDSLEGGCKLCKEQLESRNFYNLKARIYDLGTSNPMVNTARKLMNLTTSGRYELWPTSMEFELSNTCNLECVMCNGYFSSSIRKNRENLPPTENPYDENFVQQLKLFLPHMWDARFLGGEPFLIDIYYRIWEEIAAINPDMRVHITTNATVLNNRAKQLLDKLNCHMILSMDSVVPETYEKIRHNAKFSRVWEHVEYLLDYTRRKKTQIRMAVCPMTLNWEEMPELLALCNNKGIKVFFNTVYYPQELSLERMDPEQLATVHRQWQQAYEGLPETDETSRYNKQMFHDLVNQIKEWLQAKTHSA